MLTLLGVARADLAGDLRPILQDKTLARGEIGVQITRLSERPGDMGQILFKHNSDIPLLPASNLKLVTTSAALEVLGADFKFRTALLGRGADLCLIGDGDPAFGDADLLRAAGWNAQTVFHNWAELLRQRGMTLVRDVFVDDSIFDEAFLHPNWPVDQSHLRYVAQVGGVNLNLNCLDFFLQTRGAGQVVGYRTEPPTRYAQVQNTCVQGSENAVWLTRDPGTNAITLRGETNSRAEQRVTVTLHDPPLFAARVLAETMAAAELDFTGQVARDRTIRATLMQPATQPAQDSAWVPLAVHETPLAAVLARANKDSINLYAEALFKRMGFAATGQPGSWENGRQTVGRFLESIGVKPDEFQLDDGSGLSRHNRISANAMARVLAHRYASPSRDVYLASLSVAGFDGTLDGRFKESDLRGRVYGKTGYIRGVSSMSGYVKAKDGQWYAFAILMNDVTDIASCKRLQERIVKAIDQNSGAVSTKIPG